VEIVRRFALLTAVLAGSVGIFASASSAGQRTVLNYGDSLAVGTQLYRGG